MRGTDYIVKRTVFAIVTVFVAITLNFVLFRALPGNAVSGLRCGHCTKQFRDSIVKQYGLDKPKLDAVHHLSRAARPRRPRHVHVRQPAGVERHRASRS